MSRFIVYILLATVTFSCKNSVTNGDGDKINPQIKRIKWCCTDFNGGNFRMGVWFWKKVFCVAPGRLLQMDDQLDIIGDSLILWPGPFLFVSRNTDGSKLLTVKSQYIDVSIGRLSEWDASTYKLHELRDSTYNISSALYLPQERYCIYYSYGNSARHILAGYYLFDLTTSKESLLLQYVSEIGPAEVTNGFDISPDGSKLLIPINRADEPPLIVEFNLSTQRLDTLLISFDRQLLWLRYHPNGNQILYSNYPKGSGGSSVATDSEMGIIEKLTMKKRVLDVNTNPGGLSVSPFPNWSPDGKHIVYGSAPGPVSEPPGAKGAYSIYILRDVN